MDQGDQTRLTLEFTNLQRKVVSVTKTPTRQYQGPAHVVIAESLPSEQVVSRLVLHNQRARQVAFGFTNKKSDQTSFANKAIKTIVDTSHMKIAYHATNQCLSLPKSNIKRRVAINFVPFVSLTKYSLNLSYVAATMCHSVPGHASITLLPRLPLKEQPKQLKGLEKSKQTVLNDTHM